MRGRIGTTLAFTRMPIANESSIYHNDKQRTESGKISSFVVFVLWPCHHQKKILFMTENSAMDTSVQTLNQLIDSDRSIIVSLTFLCDLIDISFLNENEEWEHILRKPLPSCKVCSRNNHFGFGPIFNFLACENSIDETTSATIFALPQVMPSSGKIWYVSYDANDSFNSK